MPKIEFIKSLQIKIGLQPNLTWFQQACQLRLEFKLLKFLLHMKILFKKLHVTPNLSPFFTVEFKSATKAAYCLDTLPIWELSSTDKIFKWKKNYSNLTLYKSLKLKSLHEKSSPMDKKLLKINNNLTIFTI